jgi:hypothetical protein
MRRSTGFEGSWTLRQIKSNEEKCTKAVHCNYPPKGVRFFGAINPTSRARRRFSGSRRSHRPAKEDYPEYQVNIVRVPSRHEVRLIFCYSRDSEVPLVPNLFKEILIIHHARIRYGVAIPVVHRFSGGCFYHPFTYGLYLEVEEISFCAYERRRKT